ncbi:hypothetical protein ACTA71_011955 [Dictyostelium dimigraforme]
MNKITNIYFIIYLLIFLIKIANSQTVQVFDVSDQSIDTHNKYPIVSTQNYCIFEIYILSVFEIELDGESFSISTNYTPPPFQTTTISSTLILSNSTSQLHLLKFLNFYDGQYAIDVQSQIYGFSGSTIVNLNCELYDENSLEFEFTSNNRKEILMFSFNGILTIKGLKYSAGGTLDITPGALIPSFYDSSKRISTFTFGIFKLQQPDNSDLLNTNYTIKFYNFSKNITITPLYYNYSNNQNNLCLVYPQSKNFTKNSYFGSAIYTVLTNYTDNYPLLSGKFSTKYIFDKPNPAYQTENGIVYIQEFFGLGNISFQFYTQYGSSVVLLNDSTFQINEIPSITKLPSVADNIIYDNPDIGNHNYSKSMVTFYFNSISKFDDIKMIYSHRWSSETLRFPFGFESGNNFKYFYGSSFLQELASPNHLTDSTIDIVLKYYMGQSSRLSSYLLVDQNNDTIPEIDLTLVEFKHLYHSIYLVRIMFNENINCGVIGLDSESYNMVEFLDDEGNNNSGDGGGPIYEINHKTDGGINDVVVYDYFGNRIYGNSLTQSFYSINPPLYYDQSIFRPYILGIQNVSFLFNNIDTSNRSVDNIMYLNFTDPNASIRVFFLYHYNNDQSFDFMDYAVWNSTIKMFQMEFTIPANYKSGQLSYTLSMGVCSISSYFLPDSYQLNVTSSKFDLYGPIFKTIIKSSSNYPNSVKWLLEIEEQVNGFDRGEIIVRGEMDGSIYKFQLTTLSKINGNQLLGQYEIVVNISNVFCVSQNYVITDVRLYDSQGFFSDFNLTGEFIQSKNPFINYLDDPLINIISLECGTYIDDSPPILLSFKSWKNISKEDDSQTLSFEFQVSDPESGIKDGQLPIVYSTTSLLKTIYNQSEIKSIDGDIITYRCMIRVPFGFSYLSDVVFSVYGLINNGGYYSGYSAKRLLEEVTKTDYKMTGFILSKKPIITDTTKITSSGGGLLINGKNFKSGDIVEITYSSNSSIGKKSSTPKYIYFSSIFIDDIIATRQPFKIKIIQLNGNNSNEYIVYPKVFNFNYNDQLPTIQPTVEPTIQPTAEPTIQPTTQPTIRPIPCSGNPECGGINNGYCKQNYGCICYSPWIGIDCTSKVIIVPQPQPNTTNPSTTIIIDDDDDNNNNNNNSEDIIFQSLLSLVSLREVDFNSKPVNTFNFERWIYSRIDNFTNKYETTITVPPTGSNENSTTTTITATLQWFKEKSSIQFANQNLTMNPSSIKYTIELNQYKFLNKLNGLQLVMSASLSSSETNDICSDKQFGETTDEYDDISNYLKIQVGDHSLYGRFIKRAIVDTFPKTISNELLDSSMNPISSASSSQSYIGIIIPNYGNSIIIDPDFSVLIDSKSASSSSKNSICTTNNNSKLTKAQLAGIIVGSVCFASIVIISITYLLIKKSKQKIFLKKMNLKLKNVN